jgi:hypothetical protein
MSSDQTANLTGMVENKLISFIENEEVAAFEGRAPLRAANYLKLADLYHFHKRFFKEREILSRFADSEFADDEALIDIFERIENISKTIHLLDGAKANYSVKKTNSETSEATLEPDVDDELSLLRIESEPDVVELSTNTRVIHKNKNTQTSLKGITIRILSLCAVYTGRTDTDEIIELSLVLFEYSENNQPPFKLLENYRGNRRVADIHADKKLSKFGINNLAHEKTPLDRKKVLSIFEQADYVVSHNNSNVERRMLVTLFPETREAKWFSTQKDIPWRALGFESTRLSSIIQSFGRRKPRTSMERAKAIYFILQHSEPESENAFIERIHYMKPMKPIEWSKEMDRQHRRMNKKKSKAGLLIILSVLIIAGSYAALKYTNFF